MLTGSIILFLASFAAAVLSFWAIIKGDFLSGLTGFLIAYLNYRLATTLLVHAPVKGKKLSKV